MGVPFTILTGFLGAGKTTVLNRLLANPGGRRIAVLVNELGRISIDSKLIVGASGDVIELAGGCLCCKLDLRSDLWGGIVDIIERSSPDHVILETTGIAEPPALLDGLEHFAVREHVEPHGVVCALDAVAGPSTLEAHDEARIQLDSADRVLVTKLDLASEADLEAVHAAARTRNPDAERAGFPDSDEGNRALAPWLVSHRSRRRVSIPVGHRHRQIAAATFAADAPLASEPLLAAIRELAPTLLRAKGFVHVAGSERRAILSLASGRVELTRGEPWGSEPRRTELVLIGEGVSEEAIRRRLWACQLRPATG